MGLPTPGVPLAVIDENGNECPAGVEGDIAVSIYDTSGTRVIGVFDGYLQKDGNNMIELRREKATRGGGMKPRQWYLTGDRAQRDQDGYFWFVGRADDVINSSGYRIGMSPQQSPISSSQLSSYIIHRPCRSRIYPARPPSSHGIRCHRIA